jgi:hypothetical protein
VIPVITHGTIDEEVTGHLAQIILIVHVKFLSMNELFGQI